MHIRVDRKHSGQSRATFQSPRAGLLNNLGNPCTQSKLKRGRPFSNWPSIVWGWPPISRKESFFEYSVRNSPTEPFVLWDLHAFPRAISFAQRWHEISPRRDGANKNCQAPTFWIIAINNHAGIQGLSGAGFAAGSIKWQNAPSWLPSRPSNQNPFKTHPPPSLFLHNHNILSQPWGVVENPGFVGQ